jgi:hypothetical protein
LIANEWLWRAQMALREYIGFVANSAQDSACCVFNHRAKCHKSLTENNVAPVAQGQAKIILTQSVT